MNLDELRRRLDPEMAAAMARSAELYGAMDVDWTDLAQARPAYIRERAWWNEDRPEMPQVRDLSIAGPHGALPLRLYRPVPIEAGPLPVILYLHGGGWVVGSVETHDKMMRLLALDSGAIVLGVDYRLSPEAKFPVAVEETLATLDWLGAGGAPAGLDTGRLALAGDSSGANIALAAAALRKASGTIRGLGLIYGDYGLLDSPSRRRFPPRFDGVGRKDLIFYRQAYLRGPEDWDDPRFNCLDADLNGLCPTYILALEHDPLLDDSLALAEKLTDLGVAHKLVRMAGVVHGFIHYSRMIPKARQAIGDIAASLKAWLGA